MADNDNNLVFTVSSDMTAAQRGLNKFVNDVGASTTQIAKKFEAAGSQIDRSTTALQTRINGVVGLGTKATKEWTGALADQGKELERLRAQYNPLFATLNNYKTTVAEIRRAHAIGAISANEMTAAITKERQAALASTAAIKGRNAAIDAAPRGAAANDNATGRAFQTANIAAQFQDIAVQLQGGGKPLTVALQQGTQLASVFQTLGKGESVISALGSAFASLVSPVSLVTIGLIAAGGAAYQYFTSVDDGGDRSQETLKKEADLIQSVAQKWGDVLPELKRYADERQRLLDTQDQKDAAAAAASQQWDELREAIGKTRVEYASFLRKFNDLGADPSKIAALQKAYQELSDGIADGKANAGQAEKVHAALLDLMVATGIKGVGEFAKTFDKLATSIYGVSDAAEKLKNGPLFNENIDKSRLPTLGTLGPVYSDNGRLLTDPNEIDRYLKQQEDNRNPTVDTGRGVPVAVPIPTPKPIQLGEEPDRKAETAATRTASSYRDLIKSADDRIGQLKQEIELLGKYGVDADAARFALDLFQQSEDKGRSLSTEQRKEIEKKVALYKQYSETLSKAKLQQDLLIDARFNSLSKQDQQITTVLRQYGLPEDLNSNEAGQIRKSLNVEDARTELKSFFGDFKDALLNNGGDIGKAFAESISNALLNSASKVWDKWIDTFVNQLIGSPSVGGAAASNGSGLGALLSELFSGGATNSVVAAATPSGIASAGGAVDLASRLLGQTAGANASSINSFLSKGGVDLNAAQTAWCAAFVNSSLEQIGVSGSGSNVANSFLNWGTKIDPSQILRGDVLVQSRGLSAGQTGGHVGFATGATRYFGGQQQLEMLSGNLNNGVGKEWVNAMDVQARRATEAASSLGRMSGSASQATQGLGTLGNGLNKFGSSLNSMSSGGGSGGWLNFLMGTPFAGSAQLAASGGIGLFADGGHVTGPGGPTSDDVPAMLSNGEYVINAASTKRHRRLLDAINSGSIARFASGGLVRSGSTRAGGGGYGGGVVVNIQNNTSSQIKQQSKETANGTQIDVVIDELVADKMSTPGSRSRGAMASQFGLKGGLARR